MSILERIFSRVGHADYRRGIEFFNEGRFAEAANTFSAALDAIEDKTDPHYSLGRFYIAESRAQLGRELLTDNHPEESQKQLRLALEAGYRYPDLYFFYAEVCGRLNQWAESVSACRSALELNPRYVDARAYLAMALIQVDCRSEADRELSSIREEGFDFPAELSDEAAMERIGSELSSRLASEEIVQEALERFRGGDVSQARASLEAAVDARPAYADLRCKLGKVYAALGMLDLAAEQLDEAIAINPSYSDAHLGRVRLCLQDGRLQDAAGHLEALAAERPKDLETSALMAYTKLLAGEGVDAQAILDRLEPVSVELLHLRALVSWTLGDIEAARQDFSEAEKRLENTEEGASKPFFRLERDRHWLHVESADLFVDAELPAPNDLDERAPESAALLGREAASLGNWSDAASHWTNAISLGDKTPAIRAWLGEAELILGQPVAAAEHLGAALEEGSFGPWWDALGQAWDGQGDPRADDCFRKAVESPEPPIPARLRWAASLLVAGRLDEARAQYEEIRLAHPYHPVVRFVLEPQHLAASR